MSSHVSRKTVSPFVPIAVVVGASGAAKLAGIAPVKANFERWGYPAWWRPVIGAVEVGTAAAAVAGLRYDFARKLAVAGTLSTMGGAIATHTLAHEAKYNLIAPVLIAGLGTAALFDVAVVWKP